MEKTKIKNIIVIILILFITIVCFYPVFKKIISKLNIRDEGRGFLDVKEDIYKEDFFKKQKKIEAERPKLEWSRDPFQMPEKSAEETELKLSGIAFDEKGRIAIINNEIVREGDIISNAKIIQIIGDNVTIEKDGKRYQLKIY